MEDFEIRRASKFLSLILRHKPEVIGLTLDPNGWADTEVLLEKMNSGNFSLNKSQLEKIVAENDKKRFLFSEDKSKIRANQGHSISVDLQLKPKIPQNILYHGTAIKNLASIRETGLKKGKRQFVHLSSDTATARNVGQRYGKPVVLLVNALTMYEAGFHFYQSENGVWLTDSVPPAFIIFP